MDESVKRMVQATNPPSEADVAGWLGKSAYAHYKRIRKLVDESYPGVFCPEWLYGGRKHGWSLRYKKNRSFCTLIPERDNLALLIVFGKDERAKAEALRESFSEKSWAEYEKATVYHDGKWMVLNVDSERAIEDIMLFLKAKRKPARAFR